MQKVPVIEGYDVKNYSKVMGIKIGDPISKQVVSLVMEKVLDGYTLRTIEHIFEDWHWNSQQVAYIVAQANKEIVKSSRDNKTDIEEKQLQRLLRLYRKCQINGDRKQELNTLAEINKLCNLYVQKVEIDSKNTVFKIMGEDELSEENTEK